MVDDQQWATNEHLGVIGAAHALPVRAIHGHDQAGAGDRCLAHLASPRQELEGAGHRVGAGHADNLAHVAQRPGQAQGRADGIAIGRDVADQLDAAGIAKQTRGITLRVHRR